MYLFDLKFDLFEPLKERSKRKVFLKILQNSLENNFVQESRL